MVKVCKLNNMLCVCFFLCTLFFFFGGSWATKHAASHFQQRVEDIFFLSICKTVATVHLLVHNWLNRKPVSWIRQLTLGCSQRSFLCVPEQGPEQWLKEIRMALQEPNDYNKVSDMSSCQYLPWHLVTFQRKDKVVLWSSIIGCTSVPACNNTQNQVSGTQNVGLSLCSVHS